MSTKKEKLEAPKPRTLAVRLDKRDSVNWRFLTNQYRAELIERYGKIYDTSTAQSLVAEKTDADLFRALVKYAFDNIPDFVNSLVI